MTDFDTVAGVIRQSKLPTEVQNVGIVSALLGSSSDQIIKNMGAMVGIIETQETEKAHPMPKIAKGYNRTETKLVKMLTESTGAAMCDSGGAYGRNWQRNRMIKDFRELPEINVEINHWREDFEVLITVDTFHFLTSQLEYDQISKNITASLNHFEKLDAQRDNNWLGIGEDFLNQKLIEKYPDIWVGNWVNTYNGESSLSQVLHYIPFNLSGNDYWFESGDSYMLLHIHQGCDVRGGHTRPVCFKISGESFLNENDFDRRCECGGEYSDDCGYHWYNDDKKTFEPDKHWHFVAKKDLTLYKLSDRSKRLMNEYKGDYVQKCDKCREIVGYSCMAIY
jgi:hypothetical protein